MNKNGYIESLNMQKHVEGGYYAETYRAVERIPTARAGSERNVLTSIFYMLTDDSPVGRMHRNQSDIVHYFHDGAPLTYHVIDPDGRLTTHRLGRDIASGEVMQLTVKGGCWKGTLLEQGEFGLLGEAVAPGFDFRDMDLGTEALVEQFPQHADIIRRCLIR